MVKNKDVSTISPYQKWFIWGVAALFYLYETFLRVSPSVMTHSLMESFGVTSTSLGVLSSFYYYAYVPLQIPCGLIVDKIGIRIILTASSLLCIIGTYLFSISHSLMLAEIGRFIVGAGSACAFISCLKVTVGWFSPARFALVAGLTTMMGTLGGLCAGSPLALLVNGTDWRQASFYLAIAGIPVALLSWFCLKVKSPFVMDDAPQTSLRDSVSRLLKNKQVWLAGIVGGFMYLPITAFGELWGVPFFMHAHSINNELASSVSHMIFVGMALGSPFAAWLLLKMKSIRKVMQLSSLIVGLLFVGIAFTSHFPLMVSYIFVFLAGFFVGGQVLCFTVAKNNTDEAISGTVVGFTNALVMMSGIIFQPLLGHILDLFWDGALTEAGIRLYSTRAYKMSMLTIPICFVASALLLAYIKDNKTDIRVVPV